METLPDHIEFGDLVVRRWTTDEVDALHAAVLDNLDHLRPRMPWIGAEPLSIDERRAIVEGWARTWAAGGDVVYGIWERGEVVGSTGLHDRGFPDGPEIGYWVDRRHQGRGIATAVSWALTDEAFTVPGIDAVYLAHDRTNLASRRVPDKLGYTWLGEEAVTDPAKIAPADDGVYGRWRVARPDWPTVPAPIVRPA